jgi:hypothetical protein
MTRATTPEVTPVAMLVPLSLMYGVTTSRSSGSEYNLLREFAIDTRPCPGARTSGLIRPSYHVGPRELNFETSSSVRSAVFFVRSEPTVSAEGALPGEVTPA